jgi:hypothetical protein
VISGVEFSGSVTNTKLNTVYTRPLLCGKHKPKYTLKETE